MHSTRNAISRYTFTAIAAAALMLSPMLADRFFAQQPPPQGGAAQGQQGGRGGDPNSVQVGVPDGRGGRQGGARQGGAGRGGRRGGGPALPAPRGPNGRVILGGATAKDKGMWLPAGGVVLTPIAPNIPFQPWARALYADREGHRLEPHARCKASGVVRQFQTPYGVEIVELPELQRIYIFDVGGPHTFRVVYMDGRSHPDDVLPSYYGHSIGWWEGDTLVIDSVGYNESFWLDRMGAPHTERLHTVERLTRTDASSLQYEMTIDDPNVYTAPWTARFDMRWDPGIELFEYICQEANYAHDLMVGTLKSVDRTTTIIP
jgi:hypothetical protein